VPTLGPEDLLLKLLEIDDDDLLLERCENDGVLRLGEENPDLILAPIDPCDFPRLPNEGTPRDLSAAGASETQAIRAVAMTPVKVCRRPLFRRLLTNGRVIMAHSSFWRELFRSFDPRTLCAKGVPPGRRSPLTGYGCITTCFLD
jgi:hypothetical protein